MDIPSGSQVYAKCFPHVFARGKTLRVMGGQCKHTASVHVQLNSTRSQIMIKCFCIKVNSDIRYWDKVGQTNEQASEQFEAVLKFGFCLFFW